MIPDELADWLREDCGVSEDRIKAATPRRDQSGRIIAWHIPGVEPYVIPACTDCGAHVDSEWYMVTDEVWREAGLETEGGHVYACVGCLEARIGRQLRPDDFTDVPVNDPGPRNSERLDSRLTPKGP